MARDACLHLAVSLFILLAIFSAIVGGSQVVALATPLTLPAPRQHFGISAFAGARSTAYESDHAALQSATAFTSRVLSWRVRTAMRNQAPSRPVKLWVWRARIRSRARCSRSADMDRESLSISSSRVDQQV